MMSETLLRLGLPADQESCLSRSCDCQRRITKKITCRLSFHSNTESPASPDHMPSHFGPRTFHSRRVDRKFMHCYSIPQAPRSNYTISGLNCRTSILILGATPRSCRTKIGSVPADRGDGSLKYATLFVSSGHAQTRAFPSSCSDLPAMRGTSPPQPQENRIQTSLSNRGMNWSFFGSKSNEGPEP
ncbi:uncharacterized protein BJX67DRAFT_233400 [Aspergillus lucknowensis]|uniref:Uncharacterized protein n=1 Tax=Aspergillus lucknowensis TaxID=176173 RepID=A0ABR4LHA5_9EURO